jgi:hypothetical protein
LKVVERTISKITHGIKMMEERITNNLSISWLHVWAKVFIQPKEKTFVEIKDSQNLGIRNVLGWLLLSLVLGTVGHFVFYILLSGKDFSEYPPAMSFVKFFFQLLVQAIFLLLSRLLTITITQQIISKVVGGTGKYSELLLVTSAFLAPLMIVFAWIGEIPYLKLLAIPLLFFEFYLHIIAVKSVHNFSWVKAAAITMITIFISGIILIVTSIIDMFTGFSIIIDSPFINTPIP